MPAINKETARETIRPRRGTQAAWETANPILAVGELVLVYDNSTGQAIAMKSGDGSSRYSQLPFLVSPGAAGVTVADNLTTNSGVQALSAAQGVALNTAIGNAARRSQNLADLADAATARSNLGLAAGALAAAASQSDATAGTDNAKFMTALRVAQAVAALAQAPLVSGTNLKTVNGTSLLGSGNLSIAGGSGAWGAISGTITDQSDLSTALAAKLATSAGAVGTSNLAGLSVTTGKLALGAVGAAQLADIGNNQMLGRVSAGTGSPENLNAAQVKTILSLVKGDVGLGNADNTSDASKPVSTAQQAAIDILATTYSTDVKLDRTQGRDMGVRVLTANETFNVASSPAAVVNGACLVTVQLDATHTFSFGAGISAVGDTVVVGEAGRQYELAFVKRASGVLCVVTKGFLIDTTAPALGTPHVEDAAKSKILVPITEPNTPTLNGTTAGITLGGAGLGGKTCTGVAVVSGNLEITLSAPMAAGDVVTVAVAAGMVKDAANNQSAAMSATSVVNNIAGLTTYLSDNFTGTNGASLLARGPTVGTGVWTDDSTDSGYPSLLVSSNRARANEALLTANFSTAANFFDVGQTQYTAKVKVRPGNRDVGLFIRTARNLSDPGILFLARRFGEFRVTNYGVADLWTGGSCTNDESTEYELKVVVGAPGAPNLITFFVDGAQVYQNTITDFAARSQVGLFIKGDGGGMSNTGGSFDDMLVTA